MACSDMVTKLHTCRTSHLRQLLSPALQATCPLLCNNSVTCLFTVCHAEAWPAMQGRQQRRWRM